MAASAIDRESFRRINKELKDFDGQREIIIKDSRIILKNSKKAIFSIHRGDIKEAEKLLRESDAEKKKIDSMISKNSKLLSVGAFDEALQEYVEAVLYLLFVKKAALKTPDQLGVSVENYLGGMFDLTGELVRKAINSSIKSEFDAVTKIRDFVDELYSELLEFDFRSGLLRKKFDSVKYDLNKLEDIIFDLKKSGKIK